MPNWCEQELSVRGKKKDLEAFVKYAQGKNCLDHNKFIPMPKSLTEVNAGSGEELYDIWFGDLDTVKNYEWVPKEIKGDREKLKSFFREHYKEKDCDALAEKYKFNKDNHGATSWYDWAIQNWGTKWGICHPELVIRPRSLLYTFDSAWSPAEPIIDAMSKQFPDLIFTLRFWEGGMGYQGKVVFRDGIIFDVENRRYYGHRGG